jgi:hypothetical protein
MRQLTFEETRAISGANFSAIDQDTNRKQWATAGMVIGGIAGFVAGTEMCRDSLVLMLPGAILGIYAGMVAGGLFFKECGIYIENTLEWIISE